jgi:hypothetical protein
MKKILLAVGIILLLLGALWFMGRSSAPSLKTRGVMPEAREAKPGEPTGKRFGGGVIRKNEPPGAEE